MKTSDKLKVVIVDDSKMITERLEELINGLEGVEYVGCARNVPRAMFLINQENPDAIILDINLDAELPNANGLFLLITLRKKHPDMKILMLTNHSEPQYKSVCLENGADYFLDKSHDLFKIPETLMKIQKERYKVSIAS